MTISVVAVLLVLGLYLVVPIPTGEDWGWEAAIAILCVGALYVMAGVWSMVRITNSKHPMRTGLLSLSVMVTSMVVTFALVYLSMSSRNPESFNVQLDRVSALYFTMTVLSTTGFGDITASTQSAMIAVMIGLGCTADLFNLWIWFETMAISSYLLVAFYREQTSALEAGVKYLVQSAAGSVLVLIGISLVLTETGTLDLAEIQAVAASSSLMIVAGALFVIGFGVKAALVPLHTWLPDAHSQAPSGISAMLSGVVIEAGLIAMLRALSGLAFIEASWPALLMVFGALNMLLGNLMALRQTQIKRLLAYSSLAHVGYMLIGLGVALYFGNLNGAQGGFFHLFNHMLMKGLAFLAAGALLYALRLSRNSHAPLTKDDLAGAATRYPLVALTFSLAVLALGGLPPLAGFMSKWQIFVSGFQVENFWIGALVIFAALNSVLSLAYYAPLVNALYRMEPSARVREGALVPKVMQLPLAILALAVVVIGLWPALMNWLTVPAGAALLKVFGY